MVIKMDASLSCYLREEFEVLEMAFEVWRIFRNDQEESGAKGDNQEVTREKEALEKMKNMIFKSPNLQIGSPQALSISTTHDHRRLPLDFGHLYSFLIVEINQHLHFCFTWFWPLVFILEAW